MAEKITPEYLRKVPIFESLSDAELQAIIDSPDNGYEEYEMKQGIIREAEIGDCMYVILEGTVEVSIKSSGGGREIAIATLREGDFFGEIGMFDDNAAGGVGPDTSAHLRATDER